MISQQELQRHLESLGEEFRLTLPERIARIEQHWVRIQELDVHAASAGAARTGRRRVASGARDNNVASGERGQVAYELERALHSVAGCAPMFGFSALGAAARRAENALRTPGNTVPFELMREVLDLMSEHFEKELVFS